MPFNDIKLINELKTLGLTQYEAQAFIALAKLEYSDATTISKISNVPKSKIYSIMSMLEERGIITASKTGKIKPRGKIYRILSLDDSINILKQPINEAAESSLITLKNLYSSKEESNKKFDVWAINGIENIQILLNETIKSAKEEILGILDINLFPLGLKRR